ncbi:MULTISPECIES: hypothetical protein [unclassified Streptomyces]|uniref:hypothetical protein n=1 Tax=unclassified Streptomyces TaxID=2593676 RepID=UPI0033A1A785
MTTDVRRENASRRPETGWAEARRRRERAIRTCVPATADGDTRQAQAGPEWNIVRGED